MKQNKYDHLKYLMSLFHQLSDKNSYKEYREAIQCMANIAMKEIVKIERKERK